MIKLKRYKFLILILSFLLTALLIIASLEGINTQTSSDEYCMSCHVHPIADTTWRHSTHYKKKNNFIAHCVDCHLPPKDRTTYWIEKTKAGSRDIYTYWFKNINQINWQEKSKLEHAKKYVFNESCIRCHENIFPIHLSKEGGEAHFYYQRNQENLECINCHLNVGHGGENSHKSNLSFSSSKKSKEVFIKPTIIEKFSDYTEQIPQSSVSFDMVAIPNSKTNQLPYFIGKTEVSWDEYKAFLSETESEGRLIDGNPDIDAITGATPPFGDPSQGWGMGKRPAITMTWHAANTYCKWLSQKTGKTYRLPTALEWEIATCTSKNEEFFFGGKTSDYAPDNFLIKLFSTPSEIINDYVIWKKNSNGKTSLPEDVSPNKYGIVNMLGNVREFCLDSIRMESGLEHVIKGGSFNSSVDELLMSHKDQTNHYKWMITDPQIPKSIWWYSDCYDVGFRVVCEWPKKDESSSIK